ncbi:TPA: GNAT family N-acetyltransferase [Vibrio parahaemolyticus]|nr:GNAT family N-acetyltransferase [Vibrio parahaemolyticus]HCG8278609.1 GNAT family N-acetyltransferase [Vibrio parahaemolyticus]HCH0860550.1 GNAT family N-acetyltransferase [Vibrio parahaemolyticus]
MSTINLESKTIRIRFVEVSDAEFILSLRTDDKYNKYLSKVESDVEQQKAWIESYKRLEKEGKEYYFIIERIDGAPCGTVRVYDIKPDSFCWGSWILNESKTKYAALESAFLVYDFGFSVLGFNQSHFDVMKENKKVVSFHEKMGAVKVGESDDSYQYIIQKHAVEQMKNRLKSKLI